MNYQELSKEVSYVLRHAPWEYELELEDDCWVKKIKNVNGIEIHFVYNTITGLFDDFKFK